MFYIGKWSEKFDDRFNFSIKWTLKEENGKNLLQNGPKSTKFDYTLAITKTRILGPI